MTRLTIDVDGGRNRCSTWLALSKTNDNSAAILLSYGTVRVLPASDAEARKSTWRAVSTPIL